MNIKEYIPDKTKIFLSAFYIWTWIIFQMTQAFNYMLSLIIKSAPDAMIIYNFGRFNKNNNVSILKASSGNSTEITNKLKLWLNLKWDKNACDDTGGANLDQFAQYAGVSVLWIGYLLNYDKQDEYKQFSDSMDNGVVDYNKLTNLIKYIAIDFNKKIIYRFLNNETTQEDMLFGEVNFT